MKTIGNIAMILGLVLLIKTAIDQLDGTTTVFKLPFGRTSMENYKFFQIHEEGDNTFRAALAYNYVISIMWVLFGTAFKYIKNSSDKYN